MSESRNADTDDEAFEMAPCVSCLLPQRVRSRRVRVTFIRMAGIYRERFFLPTAVRDFLEKKLNVHRGVPARPRLKRAHSSEQFGFRMG